MTLETSKGDSSAQVKHILSSGRSIVAFAESFSPQGHGNIFNLVLKDDQATYHYCYLLAPTGHYRSWSRPRVLSISLALLVPKLRNSAVNGQGVPGPQRCESHSSLISC